ncbi:Zn(II)2Cys6 transcription factor [Aspergillus lucknowensis]|uniref:Zn(2)-C6 fungal-type domain-containing protein n=1 Tax=Aspergillus lucknowensis TaxID=176173 RepID=A0ABR4LU41_9EURO
MSDQSFKKAASSPQGPRQSRSCKVCRVRKVKCDRVKPCHACCTHGYPSKCVYEVVPGEDFKPVSQADEIRNLRGEIKELSTKLNGGLNRSQRRLNQLQTLFETIRSAPEDVVERLIADLRYSHVEVNPQEVPVGSWERTEALDERRTPDDNGLSDAVEGDDLSSLVIRRRHSPDPSETSDDDSAYGSICRIDSSKSMLDVFIERFVDAFSPEVDARSGEAGAIRRAAEIRMFSPILTDAFQAVSHVFFGRSVQNKTIESTGFSYYPRVLRSLQEALQDPERSKAESTLATVVLLMAFESVERTSQASLTAHVQGAVRLIEHRGPENHMYGVEHLFFTELRPYWVSAAFTTRAPSFLAREEWKTIPWAAGTTPKNILHYLLDLAVEVPALLSQHDELSADISSNILSAHERSVKQAAFWNGVGDLTNRFALWKINWVDGYPDGPPREVEATDEGIFPVFHCRDLRTGAVIAPTKFEYPDLLLTQTMCLYYASRLILSSVDTRPTDRVTRPEQYQLACGICRSLEWYILKSPGNMINRLAFPVRVAWEVFPNGGPERKFLSEVLKLVEKRHSLALWGGGMAEISPRPHSPPRTDI